jgi:hypothetical protein
MLATMTNIVTSLVLCYMDIIGSLTGYRSPKRHPLSFTDHTAFFKVESRKPKGRKRKIKKE